MTNESLYLQLKRLLTGLVDQAIKDGKTFEYDSVALRADEVADLSLPSVLCIAQDMSVRVGMGDLGYRFSVGAPEISHFPLAMEAVGEEKQFLEIAPFVLEVFEGEVMDCQHDLALLFEGAVRLLHPDFSLDANSNHRELVVKAG